MVRLKDFKWKGIKTSTFIFEAYYLVGPKIILMALYFIGRLAADNSLFSPLE